MHRDDRRRIHVTEYLFACLGVIAIILAIGKVGRYELHVVPKTKGVATYRLDTLTGNAWVSESSIVRGEGRWPTSEESWVLIKEPPLTPRVRD